MLAVEKRRPLGHALLPTLLIATSVLALAGCVSDKASSPDSASFASPAEPAAATQAAATAAATQPQAGYRDPMVTSVAGGQTSQTAQMAGQAQPQGQMPMQANAQAMAAGSAVTAPANIGGLAMQSTGINAQAMSIFSVRPKMQNNSTSTQFQPADANAYAPGGVSPARSSVYSSQFPVDPQQAPQGVILPQQSSENTSTRIAPTQTAYVATGALAGQTSNALYSAPKQNLLGSLSGLLQKASLPGMTRIAPNGLHIQNDKVEVGCFKPNLLNVIKAVETHFGKPVLVTSGYRDPQHNRMVGGAEESMHKSCDAADIQISGVSKWEIAGFIRSLPDRGGVGTYCHTDSVHLDTGRNRDWNWGCGGKAPSAAIARAL
ncbi:D-Ala-D-Ala carboxypeptidase family metallohydrolase [Rhizobium sp. S152]|uniref:YcbK family protein n=1 Tax=Rhizobium sp. S152 TaxID=3055038 RepID=UPI0025AA2289|nr:D-Ala-D-Ala carboxypeptidase family metallohydrolase [Rhizobium sp. S152]MDM9628598.1 D-Ala-D-Ala carboxypeptidase family metallohydrolase [Rhizobium sp. S152]